MLTHIPWHEIHPSPSNPRRRFDEASLAELAASIREQGILQPVIVRRSSSFGMPFRYELVCGERRYRACLQAGVVELACIVRDLSDEQVIELQLTENDQRSGVTPLEEADAIVALASRFSRSPESIADKLGRPVEYVRRRLLLGDLIEDLRVLLDEERIGIGSAEMLASLPAEMQGELRAELRPDATHWNGTVKTWTRRDVAVLIARASRELARAPWALDDEALGPHACTVCPHRSSCQPSLLGDLPEGDRCLDAECWAQKTEAWVAAARASGVTVLEGEDAEKAVRYGSGFREQDLGKWVEREY